MKLLLSSCITLIICLTPSCQEESKNTTTYVTTVQKMASDGLDLQAVTELATKVKTPQELEKSLNAPNNKVNNLDLNEDNVVDFIKVTEINNDTGKGFSLTTEVAPNDEQELAVIQFEVDKATQQATVQTTGNPQVYGNNNHYHNRMSLTDVLIWGYFLNKVSSYISPWGYNRQPPYYQRREPVSSTQYRNNNRGFGRSFKSSTSSVIKKPLQSPNYNKTAKQIKAPLKNPTQSQRSFQKLNPSRSRPTSATGFGSKKRSTSSQTSGAKGTGFGQKRTTNSSSQSTTQPRSYSRGSQGTSFGTRSSSRYGSSRSSRSRSAFGGGK